jgi:hypothetical protein
MYMCTYFLILGLIFIKTKNEFPALVVEEDLRCPLCEQAPCYWYSFCRYFDNLTLWLKRRVIFVFIKMTLLELCFVFSQFLKWYFKGCFVFFAECGTQLKYNNYAIWCSSWTNFNHLPVVMILQMYMFIKVHVY